MIVMICDDQKDDLEKMIQIVSEYAKSHPDIFLEIHYFSNSFAMLDEINKSGAPDIALLDICMPGVMGTEIAREIQKKGEDATDIIFITTSPDFAIEAFTLHINDYLIKPYTKERLIETLNRVIEKRQKRVYVTVACGRDVYRIDLYQVLYAETKNHSLEISLIQGNTLKTNVPLTEFKDLFQNMDGFVSVGASYIVNLRYVQSLLQSTLVMVNGDVIPVPRRLRSEIKRKYFDFYIKEATGT